MNQSSGMPMMSPMISPMTNSPTLPPNALSPAELFAMVKSLLNEEIVSKINAVFQFNLSGPNGGNWCIDLRNGNGFIGKGQAPCEPDITLSMSTSNFQLMLYRKMSPTQAYMTGKVTVEGDFSATSKLEEFMKCIEERQNAF